MSLTLDVDPATTLVETGAVPPVATRQRGQTSSIPLSQHCLRARERASEPERERETDRQRERQRERSCIVLKRNFKATPQEARHPPSKSGDVFFQQLDVEAKNAPGQMKYHLPNFAKPRSQSLSCFHHSTEGTSRWRGGVSLGYPRFTTQHESSPRAQTRSNRIRLPELQGIRGFRIRVFGVVFSTEPGNTISVGSSYRDQDTQPNRVPRSIPTLSIPCVT